MQLNKMSYLWHQNLGWHSDSRGVHLCTSQEGQELFLEIYVANSQLRVRYWILKEEQLEHIKGVWFRILPTGDEINLLNQEQHMLELLDLALDQKQEYKLELQNAILTLSISTGGIVEVEKVTPVDSEHTNRFS